MYGVKTALQGLCEYCRNADFWAVSNCRVLGSDESLFASHFGSLHFIRV